VLHDGGHHDVIGSEAESVREVIDGLGGVSTKDHDVVSLAALGEVEDASTSEFISGGGRDRLVARSPVDARVVGKELRDRIGDELERSGRGSRIEIEVGDLAPVQAWREDRFTDEVRLKAHSSAILTRS